MADHPPAAAPSDAPPLVQLWNTEDNASDILDGVYPDSVVVLQGPFGSAVVCLEIDEGTEHGPDIRDKPARYADALRGRAGWHVVFVAPGRERTAFLARVARRNGGRVLRAQPERLGEFVVKDFLRTRRQGKR